jgi:hypothetical protein
MGSLDEACSPSALDAPVEPTSGSPAPGVLCYVESGTAFFTTQAIDKQWGDDWNDAPYEHNAGDPYEDHECPARWMLTRVKFDGGALDEPREGHYNSPWSVEQINCRDTPWLSTEHGYRAPGQPLIEVWAGERFEAFRDAVHAAGGTVYLAVEKTTTGSSTGANGGMAMPLSRSLNNPKKAT